MNILKASILLLSSILIPLCAYADVQANLVFRTTVPTAVSISKKSPAQSISASPETGVLSSILQSVFELDTNDTDETSEFIMSSTLETSSGNVSAYDAYGNLLFGNIDVLPSEQDVSEAKLHTGNNNNVIVYPATVITSSPFTSEFKSSYKEYENCYVIYVNDGTEGTVTQSVSSTPIAGTFSKTKDTAGTYKAVITLSAVSK